MRLIYIFILFNACTCNKDELTPVNLCGRECYTGPAPIMKPCTMGIWQCDQQGKQINCIDQITPTDEICDNIDNNCDGQIDEGLADCCRPSGPEICDRIDNDCDGRVDELDDIEFCFDGARQTAANLPCRPGVKKCEAGMLTCTGQILPSAEICDSIDNDCDGQIDEGLITAGTIDLVFVMDNSGSMQSVASKVNSVVSTFASKYGNDSSIRWAIVAAPPETMPDSDGIWRPEVGPKLISNFTDTQTFIQTFATQRALRGAGDEPTIDALAMIMDNNKFNLNWTSGSKRVVVLFTDEEPQSYSSPIRHISDITRSCFGYTLLLFVTTTDLNWRDVAIQCAAIFKDIRSDTLVADLERAISAAVCR